MDLDHLVQHIPCRDLYQVIEDAPIQSVLACVNIVFCQLIIGLAGIAMGIPLPIRMIISLIVIHWNINEYEVMKNISQSSKVFAIGFIWVGLWSGVVYNKML